MANPTTITTLSPFDIKREIQHHHADFMACRDAAWQCRQWAKQYMEAADIYDAAATTASKALERTLQLKWSMEGLV